MYKVYYMLPKQHPVFIAEFEDEQYAQVLVDTGNKLYDDGREFWLEEDDYTDQRMRECENHGQCDSYDYKAELLRDFDRTEARAINRSR